MPSMRRRRSMSGLPEVSEDAVRVRNAQKSFSLMISAFKDDHRLTDWEIVALLTEEAERFAHWAIRKERADKRKEGQ